MERLIQSTLKFILINLVLIGCTNSRSHLPVSDAAKPNSAESQLLTLDLKNLPDKSVLKLSDIGAMDIEYLPLKTAPQIVISQIIHIFFSKSFFLTRSISSINMFRNDGSFISEVSIIGRGPSEFTGIIDVDINPENESIYIANGNQQKFMVFNKNGKFVRTFNTPLKGDMKFKFTEDGILCFYNNELGNIEDSFILIDTTGKIIKNFSNKYPWKRKAPGTLYEGENLFYRFNNQLFKKEIYCDTIFAYKNKGFEPHMVIDVGNQRLTTDVRTKIKTRSDASDVLQNFINPWNLFEFGDFVYYEMAVNINGVSDLYSFIGSKKNNFRALVAPYEGLINDLDGGPYIWPKTFSNDSTIISWIDAYKLKEYLDSEAFKNTSPKYPEKKQELEKIANSIQNNDNPIIIRIKVK